MASKVRSSSLRAPAVGLARQPHAIWPREARVVLGARRADRIDALAKELTAAGHKARAVSTDVTDRDQVKNLVDSAVEEFGRIDVMLNDAGLMPLAPLERLKLDEWDRMIDVNIKGVLYGIAAALPHMKEQKSGHIINVSSVYGHVVDPGAAVYCATKFAVRALSEGLRQEVKPYNIRTTVISPGAVSTELLEHISEKDIQAGTKEFVSKIAVGEHFRPHGRLCGERARRRRRQRDPVPPDRPAGLTSRARTRALA